MAKKIKDKYMQLEQVHAICDNDEITPGPIDVEEFAKEVKEAQEAAARSGIDMKNDFSCISESLAKKLVWCCKSVAREPRFANLTWELEDDCVSTGCMYCMKYAVKNFDIDKCFGRIIPYFKQVARSGFYRTLERRMRQMKKEEEARQRALQGSADELGQLVRC